MINFQIHIFGFVLPIFRIKSINKFAFVCKLVNMSDQKHGVSTLAQGTFATAEGRSNGFRARNCEGRWPPRDPTGAYRGVLGAWWWISCDMWVDMSGRVICYI